jgi:hypothetical protein
MDDRIAVITYKKFCKNDELWPDREFQTCRVELVNGEEVDMDLAERRTLLSNKICVREVRHRDKGGRLPFWVQLSYRRRFSFFVQNIIKRETDLAFDLSIFLFHMLKQLHQRHEVLFVVFPIPKGFTLEQMFVVNDCIANR